MNNMICVDFAELDSPNSKKEVYPYGRRRRGVNGRNGAT